MNISNGLKVMILAALITVAGNGQIEARGRHHHGVRPPCVVVHVPASRPVVTSRVSNRFCRQERLAMAIAYLGNHKHLTVKQYAKITGQAEKTGAFVKADGWKCYKFKHIV